MRKVASFSTPILDALLPHMSFGVQRLPGGRGPGGTGDFYFWKY
jgi:hypothetical protein